MSTENLDLDRVGNEVFAAREALWPAHQLLEDLGRGGCGPEETHSFAVTARDKVSRAIVRLGKAQKALAEAREGESEGVAAEA